MASSNVETYRDGHEAFNQRDFEAMTKHYADSIIWRERDRGDAVYLHRIVVNPAFKGQKLFGDILSWAIGHGKEKGMRHVRLDTWANNPQLIKYYQGFGFRFVENFTTPDDNLLPVHNRNLALALLEYEI